jgi:hypothetical protein
MIKIIYIFASIKIKSFRIKNKNGYILMNHYKMIFQIVLIINV